MKLFLIRHAEAIDYETESVRNDEHRYITPKGRKVSAAVFRTLKDNFADLDKIFTSPLIRAVQTAEVLAISSKYKHDVEIVNELLINSSTARVSQLLKRNTVFNTVALIGHEPMMSSLVTGLSDRKNLNFQFKKSGVCYIDYDPEKEEGVFNWYFSPKTSEFIK
jgi:phosphohistidine phosphatase